MTPLGHVTTSQGKGILHGWMASVQVDLTPLREHALVPGTLMPCGPDTSADFWGR